MNGIPSLRKAVAALGMLFLLGMPTSPIQAEGWGHYGGDPGGSRYSPLDQINAENVSELEQAWRYSTGERANLENASLRGSYQATPILAEGKFYVSSPFGRVFALDPTTGAEIWRYDARLDLSKGFGEQANRGVSSWLDPVAEPDQPCRHRIFLGTLDGRLIAIDGADGRACPGFGDQGAVDLRRGVRAVSGGANDYTITSPSVTTDDLVITGSAIGDNRAVELELGIVRAFDARSGELVWSWDPLPRSSLDPGHQAWKPEQVARTGAANAWPPLAVDQGRDLLFVPTGSASPDYYGGERLGDNRYANSLVALRASTGELVWWQQLVHHDLWDYDLPAQPSLVDLEHDGERVPSVLQVTKMGLLFAFERETGEPIFEIEERPMPVSDVPGEEAWPTQPFPVSPPPLVRHEPITEENAWGFTFWDEGQCRDLIRNYRSEGIYTPPSLQGTVQFPGNAGGANWGGIAFDDERQIAVINVMDLPTVTTLIPRDEFASAAADEEFDDSQFASQSGTPYGMRREPLLSPFGVPCVAPPWGSLVAVDMTAGDIKWRVPFGTTRGKVPLGIELELGLPSVGGPIVTGGGLVFIGAAIDQYFRAFDIETGDEIWRALLPAGGQATPMTYAVDGRQYVVIVAGGHAGANTEPGDYVVAFALPE
ncbi:MAG: pyrroloquinoline quinone-dependent dehydrogenase [Pseudomonadota bacterium]